jgi:hypothetical protein
MMVSLAGASVTIAAAASLLLGGLLAPPATGAASRCLPHISAIARGQGAPDDLAWDGHELLVSDVNRGTIAVVGHGRARTIAAHISIPEGIIPRPHNVLEVAAQDPNRILDIDLASHSRTTLVSLPSVPKQTGVDDIEAAPGGATYVPDSENGKLYLLQGKHLTVLAQGIDRPVAALGWRGGVVVAGEYDNVVWMIKGGHRTRLASIPIPDDFAIVSGHLLAVSLVSGLWEAAPNPHLISSAFPNPQGLVADGRDAVMIADETKNTIYRVTNLGACL